MAHPNLRLTLWLCLIAFTSTLNASHAFVSYCPPPVCKIVCCRPLCSPCSQFVETGCAYFDEKAVCGESIQISADVSYTITTGFASGTRDYACLTPKWQQQWKFEKADEIASDPDMYFLLKDDYCIYALTGSRQEGGKLAHQRHLELRMD